MIEEIIDNLNSYHLRLKFTYKFQTDNVTGELRWLNVLFARSWIDIA